jgi:hypothetical protein
MNILSNLSRISVFEFRPFITVSFILVLIFSFSLTGNLYAQMPSVVCSADANGIPYQICQYSNLQLHAVEENGQQGTFHWVGPNNFQSSVQNPILTNISTLSTGNYSVTFTNNQNQTSSCTIEIIVRNCCLSANTPSNFLTGPISQIGAIDYSLPIICDNLLIDNNFSFPPLTNLVFTDQNTQKSIIVQPGSELKLSNSHVTQCFSAYHGIVIEPEGLVNIEDCYFEYATTMIVAKGGSGLTVKNSRFHANHIAIDVPPPFDPTIYQSVNPFYLTGNIFECTSESHVRANYPIVGFDFTTFMQILMDQMKTLSQTCLMESYL